MTQTTGDAEFIFQQGIAYAFCSEMMGEHCKMRDDLKDPRFPDELAYRPASVPAIVLGAFAVELLMKSLILITVGDFPKKHRIADLYALLRLEDQQEIKMHFDEYTEAALANKFPDFPLVYDGVAVPGNYYQLEEVLNRLNDAFVDWRYLHDAKKDLDPTGFGALIAVLNHVITTRNPAWSQWLEKRGEIPLMKERKQRQ